MVQNMNNFINNDSDYDTETDTESSYNDSESDSDSETDTNDILYEPEEPSVKKYNIVLCELYNDYIHGEINDLDININKLHLVLFRFKLLDSIYINRLAFSRMNYYTTILNNNYNINHNIYKNYKNIISSDNYIKPELAQCIYLPSGHCICIIKTFWLKIIQRKWKLICKQRKHIINCRSNPYALLSRSLTGKWPDYCIYLPGIKGMLQEIGK